MIRVAVTDEVFFSEDNPYQAVLWFNFINEEDAFSFVKEMLKQDKVSHVFYPEVDNVEE